MKASRSALIGLLWGALLVVIAPRAAWLPARTSVYPIYAEAGRNWWAGQTCYGQLRPEHDVFRFSPVVAQAFVPLGFLPDEVGGPLWLLLTAGVFAGGLAWYLRTVRPPGSDFALWSLLLGLI